MAINQSFKLPAHHNIYTGSEGRELRIDYSLPQQGTNEDTGLILFSPGFGGHIDSKVYKKMRENFADKYNLITVQCDYFGSEFMQEAKSFTFGNEINSVLHTLKSEEINMIKNDSTKLLQILSNQTISLPVKATLNETEENFNDMSFQQAIDLITAIEAMKLILIGNKIVFNSEKIIGYGHSHGAYLLHLSNRLAPHLFAFIIDNSSWITPAYLNANRVMYVRYGQMTLNIEYDYLAKNLISFKQVLDLRKLYKDFENKAVLIVVQGTNDNLINHKDKMEIVKRINKAQFYLIGESEIDNKIFKSNSHGLDADFLQMFKWAYQKFNGELNDNPFSEIYEINLDRMHINVDYSSGLPLFTLNYNIC